MDTPWLESDGKQSDWSGNRGKEAEIIRKKSPFPLGKDEVGSSNLPSSSKKP